MMRLSSLMLPGVLLLGLTCAGDPHVYPPPHFEPVHVLATAETFYPAMSIAYGTVILEVTVGPSGSIDGVKVVKDIPSLTSEAERAVAKWKFKPAKLDGKPIASTVVVAFTFSPPVVQRGGPP